MTRTDRSGLPGDGASHRRGVLVARWASSNRVAASSLPALMSDLPTPGRTAAQASKQVAVRSGARIWITIEVDEMAD